MQTSVCKVYPYGLTRSEDRLWVTQRIKYRGRKDAARDYDGIVVSFPVRSVRRVYQETEESVGNYGQGRNYVVDAESLGPN